MTAALADWIKKAENDYRVAVRLFKDRNIKFFDGVCFHCQQSVEKYLKAVRVYHDTSFQRIHALIPLLDDCIKIDPSFEFIRRQCLDMTGIDQFRYPSDFANEDDATLALRSAKVIRTFIREKLGLAKQRARKKSKKA